MNNETGDVASPQPFRVCENCRALTPANLPTCADCGAPSFEQQLEEEAQWREQRFVNAIFSRPVSLTYVILVVNILIYLLMVFVAGGSFVANFLRLSDIGTLIAFGAKTNLLLRSGELFRLITPIFIHGGLLHLASNSYALWTTGPLVERLYGRSRFLLLYLVSGIGGVIGSYLGGLAASPDLPSVGASGAIFGLFGALFVVGYRYRADLPPDFARSIRSAMLPVIAINLVIGLSVSWIDNGAHIGGLLTGAILVFVVPYLPPNRSHDSAAFRLVMGVCVALTIASFVGAWQSRGPHLRRRVVEVRRFLDGLEAADETLVSILREPPDNSRQSDEQLAQLDEVIARLENQPGPDPVADACRTRLIDSAQTLRGLLESPDPALKAAQWRATTEEVLTARQQKIDWVRSEGGRYGFRLVSPPDER
ncbi:MAG: rhomboid family intramembrane serine protease [Blastocatellia bacterium]